MKASVIISAYNNLADLRLLLPALERQVLGNHAMEIILRDDGSNDKACQWIRTEHPGIQLIRGENIGFSRSNNIAAHLATGDVLVFVNADTMPDKHFIAAGLNLLDREPQVGGISGNMIMPWVMNAQAFLAGERPSAGYGYFLNRYGFADYRETAVPRCEIGFLSGGGCFVRRNALDNEDPFSENLWGGTSYCEDLDLSLRLLAKGWRLCFESTAIIFHNQRPIQQPGFGQLKKFFRVSTNRMTVYALNLSLACFLRLTPVIFYGLFFKLATLPMAKKTKKKAMLAALMVSPLFVLLLPYWFYRNLQAGSSRQRIKKISFLKKLT